MKKELLDLAWEANPSEIEIGGEVSICRLIQLATMGAIGRLLGNALGGIMMCLLGLTALFSLGGLFYLAYAMVGIKGVFTLSMLALAVSAALVITSLFLRVVAKACPIKIRV